MSDKQEKMILEHEPVPGYQKAFYIVMTVGVLYLVIVLGRALL